MKIRHSSLILKEVLHTNHLGWGMGVLAKHEYLMLTSDAHGVGHCRCRLSVGGNREDLTLSAGIYWKCVCGCAVGRATAPRRLWPPAELAVLPEGGRSSFASGLIICAMTG